MKETDAPGLSDGAELAGILKSGASEGAFSGAQGAVFYGGRCIFAGEAGKTSATGSGEPVGKETLFDLASLTKVLAATPAILRLIALKEIALTDSVTRFWPEFAQGGKSCVTIEALLCHASGLPPWKPLFLDVFRSPLFAPALERNSGETSKGAVDGEKRAAFLFGREVILDAVAKTHLEAPCWEKTAYSDLGFIALGHVAERVTSMSLSSFVREEVCRPLSLPASLAFRPLPSSEAQNAPAPQGIAATGLFRPREPAKGQEDILPMPDFTPPLPAPVFGEVDDDNAFAMGGVSGHAGMFGTAFGVSLFGERVLEELMGANRLGSVELWQAFCSPSPRMAHDKNRRALGFDLPSPTGSSAGSLIPRHRAVGHLGFTGTSLWIDLDTGLSAALVTNSVHPRRGNAAIRAIRPAFADAACRLIGQG